MHAVSVVLKDLKIEMRINLKTMLWLQGSHTVPCVVCWDHLETRVLKARSFGKPTAKKTRKYSHGGTSPNKNCLFKFRGYTHKYKNLFGERFLIEISDPGRRGGGVAICLMNIRYIGGIYRYKSHTTSIK